MPWAPRLRAIDLPALPAPFFGSGPAAWRRTLALPAEALPPLPRSPLPRAAAGARCATAVHCGESSLLAPVARYLREEHGIASVEVVRDPFAARLRSARAPHPPLESLRWRLRRSAALSRPKVVAFVRHAGCALHDGAPDEHLDALCELVERSGAWRLGAEAVGLWLDEDGVVDRIA